MPITPQELFSTRIPKGLVERPGVASELAVLIQFHVSGPMGGDWVVDTMGQPPSCVAGQRDDALCVITMTDEALLELISTDSSHRPPVFMKHILEGTIEIEGDATMAMRLSKVFAIGAPELTAP